MRGLGTIINALAILTGGILGIGLKRFLKEHYQETIMKATGIVMIMASSMGKGCVFSFIPVAILQGSMTLLAVALSGFMTTAVLDNLALVGNILIFCVGVNLIWPKTIKVANLLPSLVAAVLFTYIGI